MTTVRAKGTGTIVTIKGQFYARWRVAGRDTFGPARDSRDEAELDRINGKPGTGQLLFSQKDMPTLYEFARACLDPENEKYGWYGRGLANTSFNTSESILSNNLQPSKLGKMKLNRIEPEDVEEWVRGITRSVVEYQNGVRVVVRKEQASPSWVRRCHAFVSRIFTLAIKAKLIKHNPAWKIDLPAVPERANRVLSFDESAGIYQQKDRTGAIMIVAADLGLRRSEIQRMQWSHIKPEGLYVTNEKNNQTVDIQPLTDEARAALMRQPKRSMFVFTTESGKPLSKRNITRDVKARLLQMGLPEETRLQDLRGTFTNHLISAGADIKTVQKLARHASAKTTLNAYLRTTTDQKAEAIELVRKKKGLANEVKEEVSTSKLG